MAPRPARIRYLSIFSEQPQALASYYTERFGFSEIARADSGDVSLSDGGIRLAIVRLRDSLGEVQMTPGPHHLGIAVESIEAVKARFRRLCPRGVLVPERGSQRGEVRLYDPECGPISLSSRAFGLPGAPDAPTRLRHVTVEALDPAAQAEFYAGVFGFDPLPNPAAHRQGARPDCSVSDGHVIITFRDFYGVTAGPSPRYGVSGCVLQPLGSAKDDGGRDPDGNRVGPLPGAAAEGRASWHA
jgi:catechol 2,3-dioxygenase-like lactoylglutathione lyase family enzyme